MLQHGANLFHIDAWEPLNKLRYQRTVFESMEGEMMDAMHAVIAKWDTEEAAAEQAMEGRAE